MKNALYYHIYLTDDYGSWANIFMDQMKIIEDVGLKNNLHDITFSCITKNDRRWPVFQSMARHYFPDCKLHGFLDSNENDNQMLVNLNSDKVLSENLLLQLMYRDCVSCTEDFNILYLHTKGVTAQKKHLEVGDVDTYIKYYYWRNYLQWGVLKKWKECVGALDSHDTSGASYTVNPSPHYSGNFWWSKSSHIKELPNPAEIKWFDDIRRDTTDQWLKTAGNRFRDEMWVCSKPNTKSYNVYTAPVHPMEKIIMENSYVNM